MLTPRLEDTSAIEACITFVLLSMFRLIHEPSHGRTLALRSEDAECLVDRVIVAIFATTELATPTVWNNYDQASSVCTANRATTGSPIGNQAT